MDDIVFIWLGLLGFAYLLLGPVSIILSIVTRRRLRDAEARIGSLTQRLETFERPPAPLPVAVAEPGAQAAPEPATDVGEPIPEAPVPATEPSPEPVRPAAIPDRPRRSFEEAFGTRWVVWVGGVALALGALLLVRYSIEAGFFGPAARVATGLLLAVALVGGGEKLRRQERGQGLPSFVDIPAVLTASGAISAFGSLYAAYAVCDFIGGPFAFLLLALVAFGCLLAANRHGPALAAIGLLGSMVTPALVSSEAPNPFVLTTYLAIVAAVTFTLAHVRRWLWLALSTSAGAGLWTIPLWNLVWERVRETVAPVPAFAAGSLHLILQAAMATLVLSVLPYRGEVRRRAPYDADALVVPALFALLAWWWLNLGGRYGQYGTGWIVCAAALLTIMASAGLFSRPARLLVAAAGLFTLALLFFWPAREPISLFPGSWQEAARLLARPLADPGGFAGFALIAALGLAVIATRRLRVDWRLDARDCAVLAGTSALTPLGALVIAYLRLGPGRTDWLFATLAAALAVLFVFAATRFREAFNDAGSDDRARLEFGLGAAASASFAALALAMVLAINGGMLTVSLALAALGCAYVSVRMQIPALRWCVAGFGVAIAARLVWDPRIVGESLGTTPVFNWLLFGYGVPALAFGWSARMLRRAGEEDTPVRIAQSAAIVLSGFLVLFEIRHALYQGDIFSERSGLVEQGLMTVSAFGFSAVLARLDAAHGSIVFRVASYVFGIVSLVTTVIGLGLVENPWISNEEIIGGAVFNTLLLGYAIPALAAYGLARTIRDVRPKPYVLLVRIATMLLTFAYLSLETRRLFHDGYIGLFHGSSDAEIYTYSAVWLGFGILLLAYGLWRVSREVRLASAAFVTLSVLKVFLIDLAGLEGLLRAMSFIGLGIALIGIGLVYQKLVFRPRPPGDALPVPGDVV